MEFRLLLIRGSPTPVTTISSERSGHTSTTSNGNVGGELSHRTTPSLKMSTRHFTASTCSGSVTKLKRATASSRAARGLAWAVLGRGLPPNPHGLPNFCWSSQVFSKIIFRACHFRTYYFCKQCLVHVVLLNLLFQGKKGKEKSSPPSPEFPQTSLNSNN